MSAHNLLHTYLITFSLNFTRNYKLYTKLAKGSQSPITQIGNYDIGDELCIFTFSTLNVYYNRKYNCESIIKFHKSF